MAPHAHETKETVAVPTRNETNDQSATESPRYFVDTDGPDGTGSLALWRTRPDEPNRPDPVLWQHSADPGVWEVAVANLIVPSVPDLPGLRVEWNATGDVWVPATLIKAHADDLLILLYDTDQVVRTARRHVRRAGTSGGGER